MVRKYDLATSPCGTAKGSNNGEEGNEGRGSESSKEGGQPAVYLFKLQH